MPKAKNPKTGKTEHFPYTDAGYAAAADMKKMKAKPKAKKKRRM